MSPTSTDSNGHDWIDVRSILPADYEVQVAEVSRLLDAIEPITTSLVQAFYRLENGYEAALCEAVAGVVDDVDADRRVEVEDGLRPTVDALSGHMAIRERFSRFATIVDTTDDCAGASRGTAIPPVSVDDLPTDPRARCHALATFAERLVVAAEWLVDEAGPVMSKLEAQRVREGLEDDGPMFDRQALDGTRRVFDALLRLHQAAGAYDDGAFLGIDFLRAGLECGEPEYRAGYEREIRALEERGCTY